MLVECKHILYHCTWISKSIVSMLHIKFFLFLFLFIQSFKQLSVDFVKVFRF